MSHEQQEALMRARVALVQAALEEDVGEGDWTTEWTVDATARSRAVIVAKQPLVAAGTRCVMEVFRLVDPDLLVDVLVDDGERVEAGGVMIGLQGRTRSILTGERTALNFLGRLSGIATLTRAFTDAVAGTGARVIDTRKTTPGFRLLEKAAVRAGGGANHRVGLYDMVLVKDNHADARGGVAAAARAALEHNTRGLRIEVEVRTLEELDEVLGLGVDRILLDNMSLESMREAVRRTAALGGGRPELEASGNVTLDTVRAVAETGVDLISVGALTHSAPTADVSLRVVG
jgi:nicotinate-nucleotide pyrophosphorylase (carboxylating)